MGNTSANLLTIITPIQLLVDLKRDITDIEEIIGDQISINRNIVFTGVGKSGHVAKLIASTYASLGIKSRYIDPVDILHGEMRTISPSDDFIVYISKSGKTGELCVLSNHLWVRGFDSLLITSAKSSFDTFIRASDKISLVYQREMDNDDIVPTTSLIVYLSVLQAVGVALAEGTGLHNKKFFKERHPGGTIGSQD
jgi:arabinose-5-phosphate isomerase